MNRRTHRVLLLSGVAVALGSAFMHEPLPGRRGAEVAAAGTLPGMTPGRVPHLAPAHAAWSAVFWRHP